MLQFFASLTFDYNKNLILPALVHRPFSQHRCELMRLILHALLSQGFVPLKFRPLEAFVSFI